MICVTSFSPDGYELYGRKFLETYVENWPCPIVVYYEREIPDFNHELIEYRDFNSIGPTKAFYEYIDRVPLARGMVGNRYDYNKDLWKFSRKVFAQLDILRGHRGKVFWLDADIETHRKVGFEFLESLFKGNPIVYLGRLGFHCESGFVGFDTEHEKFGPFLEVYRNCLQKGLVFTLDRWHDCGMLDFAIESTGTPTTNLSDFYKRGSSAINVFPDTVLAEYMIHKKGNRKYQ